MSSDASTQMLTEAYRPQTLDDLVGQESAKRKVGAWLRTGRIPGAILIHGEFSVGKTTLARILARTALCSAPDKGAACMECSSCLAFSKKNHRDFIEMNSASDRGIDAMRNVASKIRMKPLLSKRKVLVLDEAHGITPQGWGALLKPMEEPPPHMVIILVTTNPEKIPAPNRSRCNQISLDDFSYEDCADLLEVVCERVGLGKSGVTKDHLLKLSMAVRGHPRNALHALDQIYTLVLDARDASEAIDGDLIDSYIKEVAVTDVGATAARVAASVLSGKPGGALKAADSCGSQGDLLLDQVTEIFRQAMLKGVSDKLPDPYYESVFNASEILKSDHKMQMREVLTDVYERFLKLQIDLCDLSMDARTALSLPITRSALHVHNFMKHKDS